MARVDVIMTAYNAGLYIKFAIDSILKQSFYDFRFLIIDDGSTDNTLSIIQSYNDSRIHLICPGKIGYYRAKQLLIESCENEYIAVMDADDIADQYRLEKQVRFLDEHTDYGMVGTRAAWMDAHGKDLNNNISFYETDAELKAILLFINPFVHTSVMLRRSILVQHSLNYKAIAGEDFDLWIRINKHSKSYNLNDFLIRYRIHPNNMCHSDWYKLDEGIRQLIFNQLDMYFTGEYTEADALVHLSLADMSFEAPLSKISDIQSWVYKLIGLNKKHNHFYEPVLKQVLYERVLKRFLRLDAYNFTVFKTLMEIKKELQPALTLELRKKEAAILAFTLVGKKFISTG